MSVDIHDLTLCLAKGAGNCTTPAAGRRTTRGLCPAHYSRWKKGEPLPVLESRRGAKESLPLSARFAYFADIRGEDDCWLWRGYARENGYGSASIGRKSVSAHKFSYELHYGSVPAGLVVMHTCDVKRCVNPYHLTLGTPSDNTQDALQKGRFPVGEESSSARLTARDVDAIRAAFRSGDSKRSIAERFGVHRSTVQDIIHGRTWRNTA